MGVKKGGQTLNFSGSQIRVLNTEIGDLVAVTLAIVPDLSSTVLSVLLPAISLAKPAASRCSGLLPLRRSTNCRSSDPSRAFKKRTKSPICAARRPLKDQDK